MHDLSELRLEDFCERRSRSFFFNTHTNLLRTPTCQTWSADNSYKFLHEWAHVFVHKATPYGLFLEAVSTTWTLLLRGMLKKTDIFRNKNINNGVVSWFGSAGKDEQWNGIAPFMIPWLSLYRLRNVLEAENVAKVNADAGVCYNFLASIEGDLNDASVFSSEFYESCGRFFYEESENFNRYEKGALYSNEDCGTVGVGGAAVNEALAVLLPGFIGRNDVFAIEDFTYSIFFRYYQRVLRNFMRFPEPKKRNTIIKYFKTISILGRNYQEIERRVVCAICELALFSPIGLAFRHLRVNGDVHIDDGSRWRSISPGHRASACFYDLISYPDLIEYCVKSIRIFQDELCKIHGWPKIEDFYLNIESVNMLHSVKNSLNLYSYLFQKYYAKDGNLISSFLPDEIFGHSYREKPQLDIFETSVVYQRKSGLFDSYGKTKILRVNSVLQMLERLIHTQFLLASRNNLALCNPFSGSPLGDKVSIVELASMMLCETRPELRNLFP